MVVGAVLIDDDGDGDGDDDDDDDDANSASRVSSQSGSMRPQYPVKSILGKLCRALVISAAAAKVPWPPKTLISCNCSMAAAIEPVLLFGSREGFKLESIPKKVALLP